MENKRNVNAVRKSQKTLDAPHETKGTSSSKADLLSIAFDTFRKASETLERQYAILEKRVEELNLELDEKNKYLDGILKNLPVGVIVTDLDMKITLVNSAAEDILEGSNSILNQNIMDVIPFFPQDYFSDSDRWLMPEIEDELRNSRVKSIIITGVQMKDTKERHHGWLIILKDNTELKRLKETSERNKRLAAMGEMAASIAHQIRNPLGSIELFSSILKDELSQDAERSNLAAHISAAVSTLNNILSNMLFFANQSVPVFAPASINQILDETLAFAEYLKMGKSGIVIERLYHGRDVKLFGDSELLKQAFLNIVVNAVQSMTADGGKLTIDTEIQGSRRVPIRRMGGGHGSRGVADCLKISFADTGSGIPEDVIDRVFDPFFTTKQRGTGLGLAIVNNIIKAHEGIIEVESRLGAGTRIDIILPLAWR